MHAGNLERIGAIGRVTVWSVGIWALIEIAFMIGLTVNATMPNHAINNVVTGTVLASFAGFAVCAVAFSIWSYRAMSLAHRRISGLTISPGWSIGWYFVPIAWFWKPYEAMREIWIGHAPDQAAADRSPLIGWWWAAWVLRGLLGPLPWLLPAMPPMALLSLFFLAGAISVGAAVSLMIILHRIDMMAAASIDARIFD